MLRHRTNSQFMRKYRSGRECVTEACVFGTGWTKSMLTLDGFTGPAFERGIELKHVNERFQKPGGPPFELMAVRHDGSACGGAGGGRRRGKAKAGSRSNGLKAMFNQCSAIAGEIPNQGIALNQGNPHGEGRSAAVNP